MAGLHLTLAGYHSIPYEPYDLQKYDWNRALEVRNFLAPLFGFLRNAKPVCAEKSA